MKPRIVIALVLFFAVCMFITGYKWYYWGYTDGKAEGLRTTKVILVRVPKDFVLDSVNYEIDGDHTPMTLQLYDDSSCVAVDMAKVQKLREGRE